MDTDKAVRLSGKIVCGKAIRVEFAAPRNDIGAKGGGKTNATRNDGDVEKPLGCKTVVIRNLSQDASEDDVWHLIRSCTSATNVDILRDKETWISKGFAFVDFDNSADTDVAVSLSGKLVHGKPVSISYKTPKRLH